MKKGVYLLIFAVLLVLAGMLFSRSETPDPVVLTVWGPLEESEQGWKRMIAAFENQEANTDIEYRYIPFDEYEDALLRAFANGTEPDMFYINNAWVPKYRNFLMLMPPERMTYLEYVDTFVDVAVEDFTENREHILAVPMFMETLALFYNVDLFDAAGIAEPPATWEELTEISPLLSERNAAGEFVSSGAALGTAENVNRATDILALLALQHAEGTAISDSETGRVDFNPVSGKSDRSNVFAEYTRYANPADPTYTWNLEQWYSIDAFIDGRVAMIVNYPHHLVTIKERAPDLRFAIAPMLQTESLRSKQLRIDYANYWGLAVSARTSMPDAAWDLLQFVVEPAQHLDSIIRYTPEPARVPARRDLLEPLFDEDIWGIFARQALTARSWYQPDQEAVEKILENSIDAVVRGELSSRDATKDAQQRIKLLHDALK